MRIIMKKIPYLIVSIFLLISFLSGCATSNTKSHLSQIQKGNHIKIAFVTSVPGKISIYYVGGIVFENDFVEFDTTNNLSDINNKIQSVLDRSNIATPVFPNQKDIKSLEDRFPDRLSSKWHRPLSSEDIEILAKWGKSLNVDYVALVFPGSRGNLIRNRAGYISGKGILTDIIGMNILYATYSIQLIDVATSKSSDKSEIATIKRIPFFKKGYTKAALIKMKDEWEEYKDESDEIAPLTFKEYIDQKSNYTPEDYRKMPKSMIERIEDHLLPLILRNIEMNLDALGLTNTKWTSGGLDVLPATE